MMSEFLNGVHMKKLSQILIVATAILGVSSASANVDKTYKLLGDAPSGSKIPTVTATSRLPFNSSYKDMSDEQKNYFRSKYDNLGINDTPPFPRQGLRSIYKPVIEMQRSTGATGLLKMTATVGADGLVQSIEVHEAPNKHLAKRAKRTLRNTTFDAATCDGKKCVMTFPFQIKFQ